MDDRTFRNAMGLFATGVTVVTTAVDETVHGMTANAFMSVSLKPKLITVSIGETARMHAKMHRARTFAVNILSADQVETSMHFAGQKKKEDIDFGWKGGVPLIKNALANIVCDLYDAHPVGDHTLFIGEVKDLHMRDGTPLIFFAGKYSKSTQSACRVV